MNNQPFLITLTFFVLLTLGLFMMAAIQPQRRTLFLIFAAMFTFLTALMGMMFLIVMRMVPA